MQSVGEFLRQGRQERGLTLDEISEQTRISVPQLEALEGEDFERLPGGVFNISFARQYAVLAGLDADEASRLVKAAMAASPKIDHTDEFLSETDPFLVERPGSKVAQWTSEFLRSYGNSLGSLVLGVGLVFGGLYAYQMWHADQPAAQETAAVEAPAPDREQLQPQVTPAVAQASKPAMPIELQLEVIETVWIRAEADGERVIDGILQAGDMRKVDARDEVTLKLGNAGGVLFQLNGRELPRAGPRGHVRSVVVTPEGMEVIGPPQQRDSGPLYSERVPSTTAAVRWAELAWFRTSR